jgi:hypothetical protein
MCFQRNWVFVYTRIIRILKFSRLSSSRFPVRLRKWINVLFSIRESNITACSVNQHSICIILNYNRAVLQRGVCRDPEYELRPLNTLTIWTRLLLGGAVLYIQIINWLTSWSILLLEKHVVTQLGKNLTTFYVTRRVIGVLARTHHWNIFWANLLPFTPIYPICLRRILILSSQLCIGLPSGLLFSGFRSEMF